MKEYRHALALLKEATAAVEALGDTLIAAHIATPVAMLEDKLSSSGKATKDDDTTGS